MDDTAQNSGTQPEPHSDTQAEPSTDSQSDTQRRPGYMYDPEKPLPDHLKPRAEPTPKRRLKDVDVAEMAFRVRTLVFVVPAFVLGALLGAVVSIQRGVDPVPAMVVGGVIGGLIMYFLPLAFGERMGRMGASLYFSSGSTTPPLREFSLAESMIVRGQFEEAAKELERAAAAYPDDPEPAIRLARLYRDRLDRPEDAVHWFRQAAGRRSCSTPTEIATLREMIEIHTHRLNVPQRALPDLARLAARHPDTPAGQWARLQIADIKRDMREQQTDG